MKAALFPIVTVITVLFRDAIGLSFIQEPTGTGYYKRRDVIRLHCQVDESDVDIAWYMNGNRLEFKSTDSKPKSHRFGGTSRFRSFNRRDASPNRTIQSDVIVEKIANGSSLIFAPFRPSSNTGEYHCAVAHSNSGVVITSRSVLLKKPISPKQGFGEYMRSIQVLAGNNVVLNCTQPVHSEPATYKWRYRKAQILEEFKDIDVEIPSQIRDKVVSTENGNLYLYNVTSQFEGDYRCATVNDLLDREAVTSYYYRVFVKMPKSLKNPKISHFPWFSSTQIEVGQSLTLECNADGAPRPTVAWRFSSFSSSPRHSSRSLQYKHKLQTQHEGILRINNATVEDSGIYACELEPSGSDFVKTVNVTVVPPAALTVANIANSVEETDLAHIFVGNSVNLRCEFNRPIESESERVVWMRNGEVLSEEIGGLHQEIFSSGANLVITNAQLADSGVYQCFLIEERESTHSPKSNRNSPNVYSPFGALEGSNSREYYPTSSSTTKRSNSVKNRAVIIYRLHKDAAISVTWPYTVADEVKETTTTAMSEEALIDPPVVTRVEKQPSMPAGTLEIHWDFNMPSTMRGYVSSFSVQYCKLGQCENGDDTDVWNVGAVANASDRSALIRIEEKPITTESSLPVEASFVFRIVASFQEPFFTATSGLLKGSATIQPTIVEPVTAPNTLKAMAIGADQIATVWKDSRDLDALTPAVRSSLWYEIQWRPIGSNNGDGTSEYDLQHFSVRKPVSEFKKSDQDGAIVPYAILVDLSPSTFYEIRVRYVKLRETIGHVDAVSTWSSIVHAETAVEDSKPLLDIKMPASTLAKSVSALFYPNYSDKHTTSTFSGDGWFGASSELLYTVLGIIMGCLVITLIVFVVLCALRQKKQRKYIQSMRRQLNRMPSKENLNRLLTPSHLNQSTFSSKMHPFSAASPQGTSLSHQFQSEENAQQARFNAIPHFQQQQLFTGSALSSPTAVSAALAADISDNILMADSRPKLTMMNKANAYGTMSRLTNGGPKTFANGPMKSPLIAHNPYYRTLDSQRMFQNGGSQNGKFNFGTPIHQEQQQPLLSQAESAFIEAPYELPSAVVAATQQQRLFLANQKAAIAGSPINSATGTTAPAANSTVAQHYSTYSTFGRKNPISTAVANSNANSNMFFNEGEQTDGVALSEMGVTANGIFIANNSAVDNSNRSANGFSTSIKSSSTSPSATVTLNMAGVGLYAANSDSQNTQQIATGSSSGGPQSSSASGSEPIGDEGQSSSTFNVDLSRYTSNGMTYRPPPQLSFMS